jgi:hypothetical protein
LFVNSLPSLDGIRDDSTPHLFFSQASSVGDTPKTPLYIDTGSSEVMKTTEAHSPSLDCIVLIPIHHLKWTSIELAAISRCLQVLSSHDIVIAHPDSISPEEIKLSIRLELDNISLAFLALPSHCLSSVSSYNKLLLDPKFYDRLQRWQYLLIVQLDAWLLSGCLDPWLKAGYSYIGAPWPPFMGPDKTNSCYGVGNGGLSLRRLDHVYRLLQSWRFRLYPVYTPQEMVGRLFHSTNTQNTNFTPTLLNQLKRLALCAFSLFGFRNNLAYFVTMGYHEDHLYGLLAPRVAPWFKVAPPEAAAAFALEAKPQDVLAYFGVDVPFGCHAWERHDSAFYLSRFSDEFASLSSSS